MKNPELKNRAGSATAIALATALGASGAAGASESENKENGLPPLPPQRNSSFP